MSSFSKVNKEEFLKKQSGLNLCLLVGDCVKENGE
jgi:hypothetical protein